MTGPFTPQAFHMKKSAIPLLFFLLVSRLLLQSTIAKGQENVVFAATTYDLSCNVPLNEINIHAFRHFRRDFPGVSNESWFKTEDGSFIVSFMENARRHQVHYASRGAFLYTVEYYDGQAIRPDLGDRLKKEYPAYRIDVVTEISDGHKIFYLVKIESPSSVKTILASDGKLSVYEDLDNGK